MTTSDKKEAQDVFEENIPGANYLSSRAAEMLQSPAYARVIDDLEFKVAAVQLYTNIFGRCDDTTKTIIFMEGLVAITLARLDA